MREDVRDVELQLNSGWGGFLVGRSNCDTGMDHSMNHP